MKRNWIVVSLWAGWSFSVFGQKSLDDCIRYAWENNPRLKNALIKEKDARTDYIKAMSRFLPYISAQAETGRSIGRSVNPETNIYTKDSYNQGAIGLDVKLSLFEGFTRINRLQQTRWLQKEKEWEYIVRKNELAYQVTEAYYRVVLDNKLLELAIEQLRLGEHYMKQAEIFFELGLKSASDLQEVKARYQGDLFRFCSCEKNSQMSLLDLKERLGMKKEEPLSVSLALTESPMGLSSSLVTERIYRQSIQVLPAYKRMEMWEQAAREDFAVALGQLSPTIYARFSWNSNYYNSMFSMEQLRDNRNKYVGIGISFPILNNLDRYTSIKKKKLSMQQVQNCIEEEKIHLRNEVERLILSLRAGWEKHRLAVLQTDAEKQVLKETEKKWEEGLVSQFQLMESRNRYLTAKAEQINARLQYELTLRLAIYYQTGTFIKD